MSVATTMTTPPIEASPSGSHLRLVTDSAGSGAQPPCETAVTGSEHGTPCPPWCSLTHTDDTEGDRTFHYSEYTYAGPIGMCLDLDSDDRATIELRTGDTEGDSLDLEEVDRLITALAKLRPVLATTIAERAAHDGAQRHRGIALACTPGGPRCFAWCSDHATDPNDRHWQICFDDDPGLDFGDRDSHIMAVGTARVQLSYSHPHPELPGRRNAPVVTLALNGTEGFDLEEDQVEPLACLLLAQLAVLRGDLEGARVLRKRIASLMSPPRAAAAA